MKNETTSSRTPKTGSKPYSTPKVKAYGNIHDITAGTGAAGLKDSQSGIKPNKTLS